MQKVSIVFILVLFSSLVKSQDDSTDFTLNNIKKYVTHIEASLSGINSNITADKQQAVAQQAEDIKGYIDSVAEEMEYLPDEYYYPLSPIISSYRADVVEFKKLVLNNNFPGKDKLLTKASASLQQRQHEFRTTLYSDYQITSQPQSSVIDKQHVEITEKDAIPAAEQYSRAKVTSAVNNTNVVLVEAVEPTAITTTSNALLLDTIYQAQQQIKQCIERIDLAMRKKQFSKLTVQAGSMANAALKISDLTLLLKTDQKQNLFILANGLKNLSETLRSMALKGMDEHDEMQECMNKIAVKFSTLSTGISLVQ